MIEDRLSRDERIRLECLAQAGQTSGLGTATSAEQLIDKAKRLEVYIRGQDNPTSAEP